MISIILFVLNGRRTIEQTILSVLQLDYPSKEFIVVDGESTDGTIDILNKYRESFDHLVIEKDTCMYDAMNKGAEIAHGDYFYFIGSDDLAINSWRHLTGKLRSKNTIYYGDVYFPVTNRIYYGRSCKLKRLIWNICHQAIFYPRAVFDKYRYSTRYTALSDFHLNLQLNSDPDFRFKYINLLLAVFSEKGLSSNSSDISFRKDHLKIIRDNYSIFYFLCAYMILSSSRWFSANIIKSEQKRKIGWNLNS